MKNSDELAILTILRANGATFSSELVAHLGISRATLSRWVRSLGDRVVVIGKARSTRIAARKGDMKPVPLYRVLSSGKAQLLGQLILLENREWLLKAEALPEIFQVGEFRDGLYPGWPWFLEDLRPSGFLGRSFSERMHRILQVDRNPDRWTDDELVTVLVMWGDNLSGNFILGESSFQNFQKDCLKIDSRHYDEVKPGLYHFLGQRAIESDPEFGSSAGGEQPKFTTRVGQLRSVKAGAVMVKFSPPIVEAAGRRWADLLVAEHLANEVLTGYGIATAKTRIFEIDDRVFLESERFDRRGAYGRLGLVSLRALDAAFVGQGGGAWQDSVELLSEQKLVRSEDLERVRFLNAFGDLIANTDMHFGNLSFFLTDEPPLALAPCYDMLPMHYRPAGSGEVRTPDFQPKRPRPQDEDAWHQMHPVAIKFWQAVAKDSRISRTFQAIASAAGEAIAKLV